MAAAANGPVEACPACAGTVFAAPRSVVDHEYDIDARVRYARCDSCGSEVQTPMPDLATLASFYPDGYHRFAAAGLLQSIRNDLRIRRLSRFLTGNSAGNSAGEGAILDYGCGAGGFLRRLAERLPERELYGFEIASEAQTESLEGGRITIVRGDYRDLLAVLPRCRLITMNHVIEHLPVPLEVVRVLLAKLLPGGVLEGQTPAAMSTEQRIFGSYWSGYHAPRHTVVFSHQGLRTLFEHAAFDSVELSGAFNPAGLAVSIASLAHGDAGGRVERQGVRWLACLALATVMTPFDLLLGAPSVVDFAARRSH
jgi:SAM-dependent methyltransferase